MIAAFLRVFSAFTVFVLAALRYIWRRFAEADAAPIGPQEWRRAFETLGPTYIKLGQVIASSSTLFPKRYVEEFRRCLDRVPPEPWPLVKETLKKELGQPPEAIFAKLANEPLASASIAQVYPATLAAEGNMLDLVVKVQRRGLPALITADLAALRCGAAVLQRIPRVKNGNPKGVVEDFGRTIFEELDFIAEADRMEEFNRIMGELGRTDVCAPKPIRQYCTERVLTMERLRGIRVDDVEELRRRGYEQSWVEGKLIAGMLAWFQSMMRYGFFHGDVHAGNLLLLDDGRLGFLDFGIVGRMAQERRRQIGDYITAFALRDFAQVAQVMVRMGVVSADKGGAQMAAFARDIEEAYSPIMLRAMGDIDYAELLPKIIRVSARHGTRLPDDFVLVTRQLLYFDRYAKLLAPTMNVFTDPRLMMGIAQEIARL